MIARTGAAANVRFIGVDLAWAIDRNHTALAYGDGGVTGLSIVGIEGGRSQAAVVDAIARACADAPAAVAAIDAPLVVANATGQRPCERSLNEAYARFHAGAHPMNLGIAHARTGMDLVAALGTRLGFRLALPDRAAACRCGRWLFETYPHPAMVRLYGLTRILKYKHGTVAERRAGLRRVQERLATLHGRGLRRTRCVATLLAADPAAARGRALKEFEDRLDAVLCAYLAWHAWRHGAPGSEVHGDLAGGAIVVPRLEPSSAARRQRARSSA